MQRKLIIAAAVLVAFGLVVSLVLMNKPAEKKPLASTPEKQNPPIVQTGTVPLLKIASPQPAGNTVMIDKVAIPVHGFIVIRDAANNKIAGASNVIVFPETMDMKIAATVVKGHSYIAEIHADGDKNGLFDAAADPPFVIGGKTFATTFKVK